MEAATDQLSEPDPVRPSPLDSQISHADQLTYWSSQTADITGMLGGYPQVSRIDLQGSKTFISKVRRLSRIQASSSTTSASQGTGQDEQNAPSAQAAAPPSTKTAKKMKLALDCGAGIGRISSGLLLNVAEMVDVIEPVAKFTDVLKEQQPDPSQGQLGEIFNVGLEDWVPPEDRRYDLVWVQWCLGHLTDKQAVAYLRVAAGALAGYGDQPGTGVGDGEGQVQGWIMVKENLSTDESGEDIFDDEDSSVTRSDAKFKRLFEEAGLKIVKMDTQSGFPKSLYPVKMYALRPA